MIYHMRYKVKRGDSPSGRYGDEEGGEPRGRFEGYRIADMHCDTLVKALESGRDLWRRSDEGHLDLPRMREAGLSCEFFAVCVKEEQRFGGGFQWVSQIFNAFQEEASDKEWAGLEIVRDSEALGRIIDEGGIAAILSVEGGEVLEGEIENLRKLYNMGVRALTLTWNWRNALGDGAWVKDHPRGLTTFGMDVVRYMNDLGMIIDVSHLAEPGFWDCLEVSTQPVIASHSNSHALAPHPRNLRDSQIKAISEMGGVIGVNFYPPFLIPSTEAREARLSDVIAHIDHIVEVGGIECVALGSDFDGIDSLPAGLEDVTKLPRLVEELKNLGYGDEDLKKVLLGNVMRVLSLLI